MSFELINFFKYHLTVFISTIKSAFLSTKEKSKSEPKESNKKTAYLLAVAVLSYECLSLRSNNIILYFSNKSN